MDRLPVMVSPALLTAPSADRAPAAVDAPVPPLSIQRFGQLQRPAELRIAGGLGHLAESDPSAVRQEVHDDALGADADRLLHIVEIVLQADLQVIAGQRVEGLGQHLIRLAQVM